MHYTDAIMGAIASQITSLTIVYSTVYSDAVQRKHQSTVSLAFVPVHHFVHRGPVTSPHKWPVTQKMFPFNDFIMSGIYFQKLLCLWQSLVFLEIVFIIKRFLLWYSLIVAWWCYISVDLKFFWSSLIQVLARHMSCTKLVPESVPSYCQIDPQKQTFVKLKPKCKMFSFNKIHVKCHLQNVDHFIQA